MSVLRKEDSEVHEVDEVPLCGILQCFCDGTLDNIMKGELRTTFEAAREQDEKAKAKGAGKGDAKKKAKKGAEEKPAGLALGKGSR